MTVFPVLTPIIKGVAYPTTGEGVGGWTPPFDTLPAAFSAVGFCKLYAAYSGPLIRLRRASDNAEQDFSAAANGWVDPVAVAAWAGGDAFVVTRYDQTGNGRHVTQATAANQGKILTHCRTMVCDGVNDTATMLLSTGYGQAVAGLTHGAVALSTSVAADNVLFQINTPVPNNRFRALRLGTSGALAQQSRRADGDATATLNTPSDMGSIWHRLIARRDYANTQGTLELDGAALSGALGTAGATTSNTASPAVMAVESSGAGSSYWVGEVAAHVWFQSALSDPNMLLLDAALTPIYSGVLAVQ